VNGHSRDPSKNAWGALLPSRIGKRQAEVFASIYFRRELDDVELDDEEELEDEEELDDEEEEEDLTLFDGAGEDGATRVAGADGRAAGAGADGRAAGAGVERTAGGALGRGEGEMWLGAWLGARLGAG
jgi:hypothetical protein